MINEAQLLLANKVYKMMKDDFPKDAIAWIMEVEWEGPEKVALSDINWKNEDDWRVNNDPERLKEFMDKVDKGMRKPAILLDVGKALFDVVDGHSRITAAKHLKLKSYPVFIARTKDKTLIKEALATHSSSKR